MRAGLQVIRDQHRNSDSHQSFLVPLRPTNSSFRPPYITSNQVPLYIPCLETTSLDHGTRLLAVCYARSISVLHSLHPKIWSYAERTPRRLRMIRFFFPTLPTFRSCRSFHTPRLHRGIRIYWSSFLLRLYRRCQPVHSWSTE